VSCDWARRLMVLADSLSKEEQVDLERHLQECGLCNSEWRKWQRLFALLKQLPTISSTVEEQTELMMVLQNVRAVPDLACATAEENIWRWIDGDLSEKEVASLIVHLANCDRCQSLLWHAEQTVQLLRSLPQLKATEAEKEALKARLRQMRKRPTVAPFVWRIVFPVAAAAAILAFFALSLLRTPSVVVHSVRHQVLPNLKHQYSPKPVKSKVAIESKPSPHFAPSPQKPEIKVTELPKRGQLPQLKVQPIYMVRAEKPIGKKVLDVPETPEQREVQEQKPEQKVSEPVVAKAPEPETRQLPIVSAPSESIAAQTKVEPDIARPEPQMSQAPVMVQPHSEPRQLVALPPVTIDDELPITPPQLKLTVIPPSQRLYQQSGVAFVTVPPEKRPIKPSEEKALVPDLSIPLAAERYRSHTAAIPLLRFGFSW